MEEGRATHSSVLAWRIPRTEEHGGLQSIGSRLKWLSTQAVEFIKEDDDRGILNTGKSSIK